MIWWQHIPETLNPIAFTVGFFSVYWYAIFFLGGFLGALVCALWFAQRNGSPYTKEHIIDMFFFIFLGAVLGGRLGYVLLYNFDAFALSPLQIFIPYDFERRIWVGVSGMSYHGGLIGAALALYWFTYKKQTLSFWRVADFLVLFVPIATFFGRLGNFFNIELYGRITHQPWGMIFPDVVPIGVLRHPSTLYQAVLEGLGILLFLLLIRKKIPFDGALATCYMMLYAIARFIGEMFREPDLQMGFFFGILTFGQLLSIGMLCLSGILFFWLGYQKRATIT